ncbi:MAG: aminotransferase class I/II-fold pyridoxal phosphate-dependent enzyme, partial [Candidatus Limnocylindrales bacterium]
MEKQPDVVTLGRGEPDMPTPAHIIEATKRALDDGRTTYSNPAGLPQLRAAIAEKLGRENGVQYDADEVIVTAGAQEAIAVSMQTLLEPGDEVLLAAPYYGGYLTNITLAGGVPVPVPTFESEGFELDPDRLEAMITKRSKVIALVSPSNPTGSMLSRDSLLRIAEIVERHDLVVVSDELYEKNVYIDEPAISFASLPGMRERTIT